MKEYYEIGKILKKNKRQKTCNKGFSAPLSKIHRPVIDPGPSAVYIDAVLIGMMAGEHSRC